jgi:hypothetical protein
MLARLPVAGASDSPDAPDLTTFAQGFGGPP